MQLTNVVFALSSITSWIRMASTRGLRNLVFPPELFKSVTMHDRKTKMHVKSLILIGQNPFVLFAYRQKFLLEFAVVYTRLSTIARNTFKKNCSENVCGIVGMRTENSTSQIQLACSRLSMNLGSSTSFFLACRIFRSAPTTEGLEQASIKSLKDS